MQEERDKICLPVCRSICLFVCIYRPDRSVLLPDFVPSSSPCSSLSSVLIGESSDREIQEMSNLKSLLHGKQNNPPPLEVRKIGEFGVYVHPKLYFSPFVYQQSRKTFLSLPEKLFRRLETSLPIQIPRPSTCRKVCLDPAGTCEETSAVHTPLFVSSRTRAHGERSDREGLESKTAPSTRRKPSGRIFLAAPARHISSRNELILPMKSLLAPLRFNSENVQRGGLLSWFLRRRTCFLGE